MEPNKTAPTQQGSLFEQPQTNKRRIINGDKVLWVIIAMLSIISILLVFSSTAKMAYDISSNNSSLRFLATQLGYLGGSIVIMLLLHRVSVRVYAPFTWWIWGGFALLTFLTLFLGNSTNGAARWFPIGPINIQPSEFLKVATVLHLSVMLTRESVAVKSMKLLPNFKAKTFSKICGDGFIHVTLPIFISVGVILVAHTSSAVLIFIISVLILFIAGVKRMEIIKLIGVALLGAALFSFGGMGRSGTASGRVQTWIDTWVEDRTQVRVDYISDTERSMVAMQNGGVFGQGAGQSSMRVEMIHPESDYAFAFFVEEYGIILSVLLLLLYLWVFFRAMWIYERCNDRFKELLVVSLATLILVQALLHVLVAVNFMPETGQILPLISRGGSALFCTYMAFMLIISISVNCEEAEKAKSGTRGARSSS